MHADYLNDRSTSLTSNVAGTATAIAGAERQPGRIGHIETHRNAVRNFVSDSDAIGESGLGKEPLGKARSKRIR